MINQLAKGIATNVVSLVLAGAFIVGLATLTGASVSPRSGDDGSILKDVPSGTVVPFAGNAIPSGWLLCDGETKKVADYRELAVVLKGTPYWNGETEMFTLPNLSGRVPVGSGSGKGLTARNLGDYGGAETHKLSVAEMPSHGHAVSDSGHSHGQRSAWEHGKANDIKRPNKRWNWTGDATPSGEETRPTAEGPQDVDTFSARTGISIENSGGGQPHNIMQPFIVLQYIIKD